MARKQQPRYTRVKSLVCYVINEHGVGARQPVTLYLDTTGDTALLMHVPEHICDALGVEKEVRGHSAERVREAFEQLNRKYHDWYKRREAKPIIILHVKFTGEKDGRRIERDSFFIDSERLNHEKRLVAVGITYTLAYEVDGHVHTRELVRVYKDTKEGLVSPGFAGDKVGELPECDFRVVERVGHRLNRVSGVTLPYTPELHAKLDVICNAVNDAACALHDILPEEEYIHPSYAPKLTDEQRAAAHRQEQADIVGKVLALGTRLLPAPDRPLLKKRGST